MIQANKQKRWKTFSRATTTRYGPCMQLKPVAPTTRLTVYCSRDCRFVSSWAFTQVRLVRVRWNGMAETGRWAVISINSRDRIWLTSVCGVRSVAVTVKQPKVAPTMNGTPTTEGLAGWSLGAARRMMLGFQLMPEWSAGWCEGFGLLCYRLPEGTLFSAVWTIQGVWANWTS